MKMMMMERKKRKEVFRRIDVSFLKIDEARFAFCLLIIYIFSLSDLTS